MRRRAWCSVHPRAGGEHGRSTPARVIGVGSSPRGRGTRALRRGGAGVTRFIPARAGNTRSRFRSAVRQSVHPRAGGEHYSLIDKVGREYGSSPRGRGTLDTRPGPRRSCRFIPARAGNTTPPSAPGTASPVHPRAGGEHQARFEPLSRAAGSSPRGRGTREVSVVVTGIFRFIPARAGNTRSAERSWDR